MTNEDRAESVNALVEAFAKAMGMEDEDPITKAGDMICNILHWVHQCSDEDIQALDAFRAARSGLGHYTTEISIDYDADEVDEVGPDAFVHISVDCDGKTWMCRTGRDPELVV